MLEATTESPVCASFLYGEILPIGVHRAFDEDHLEGRDCRVLVDMGCGIGKLVVQCLVQWPNIKDVFGFELSRGRYEKCREGLIRLSTHYTEQFHFTEEENNCKLHQSSSDASNRLYIHHGNLFDIDTGVLSSADIVVLETDMPTSTLYRLLVLLSAMKTGARLLTYLDIEKIWQGLLSNDASLHTFFFEQITSNIHLSDRYDYTNPYMLSQYTINA